MTRTSPFFASSAAAIAAFSSLALGGAAAQSAPRTAEIPAGAAGRAALIAPPVPGGLTADHVAERAIKASGQLRSRMEQRRAAEHQVDAASAAFIPRVTASASYTRLSSVDEPRLGNIVLAPDDPPGPLVPDAELTSVPLAFEQLQNHYAAGVSLEVPLSEYALRLPQLHEAAVKDARAAALLAEASRLRIAAEARVLYYRWVRARLEVLVQERTLEQARIHRADAEVARDTGVASNADVLSADARAASAELGLTRAQAAAELLEQRLRVLMQDGEGPSYAIGEDLRGSSAEPVARDERALVERALAQRLEPRAMAASAGAARATADSMLASELPRLDAVAGAQYANPNPRAFPQADEFTGSWEAGLRLTFTPSDIPSAQAKRGSLEARARSLDAERAELRDGIELEVKEQLLAARESAAALASAERTLAAAEEAYRVRRMLFQNGRATSIEVSDAESESSLAHSQVIGARIERRIAEVRLAHALGDDASRE